MTTLPTDDLRRRLDAGCAVSGNPFHRAAIGLLGFADLLDRADIRRRIDIETVPDRNNQDVEAAWVDWSVLARDLHDDQIGPLHGGQDRLLRLALSIAHGTPVDLLGALSGLGHAHARAVLDAMAIALELAGDVEITDSPAYLERKSREDNALREVLADRGLSHPDDEAAVSPFGGDRP
ncbi:hypothetical protein [Nocardia carnea]|uniref:hypothetical protein n=1 Tax=Nocardia carnea TaxID=37328 RepID=UPI0002D6364D|nr:hypothetical protein [Nocardia carnea]